MCCWWGSKPCGVRCCWCTPAAQAAGAYLCFAGPARELCCESGQLLLQQLGLPLKQPLGVVDLQVGGCVAAEGG